jgi:hypothetical protein
MLSADARGGDMLRREVERIWPELEWIVDDELRKRTTEAWLVHHADFMTFEPFVKRLQP